MNSPDMQIVGEVVGAAYVQSERGSAKTFLKMFQLLAGLSCLPERECLTAAARIFPKEHAAWLLAVQAGDVRPLICGPYANRFSVTFDPELN